MGDPLVREIGRVDQEIGEGYVGIPLAVGVDHGTVLIGCPGMTWQLSVEHADELAALLITALWQAARQAGESSG